MIEIAKDGRVARISLNRPEKRNALNSATCRELVEALAAAEADPGVGAILLCGKGPVFCAGIDLEEVLTADQDELADLHERLFTAIRRARKPIVAAVRGAALAGGMGLASNAHIVIAHAEARFGLTEVRIGLWPVVVFRAVALAIGERRATELSLTGRIFPADEALRFGLVAEISADSEARALEIAQQMAAFSPAAIATGLEYVDRIRGLDWADSAAIGHQMRATLMVSEEFAESVRAFLEKRRG